MVHPHPLSGSRATQGPAAESRPAPVRAGRVPEGQVPLARACFLAAGVARGKDGELDRAATLERFRRLDALGFGVALALEPAEREELGWEALERLVRDAGALALGHGFAAGATHDHLAGAPTIGELVEGVAHQAALIEELGGVPVILPLVPLARRRAREDEYVEVYRALLARASGPLIVDWTGPALRPELQDYFPGRSFERVMALDPAKVRGARCALGDPAREVRLRRALLARDQLLFTADREHLGALLLGGNPAAPAAAVPAVERFTELSGRPVALGDFSHAMLDGMAGREEVLRTALGRLSAGDAGGYLELVSALA